MLIQAWLGNAGNIGRMLTGINTVSFAFVNIGAVKFDRVPPCLPGKPAICRGTMGDVR